MNPSLTNQPTDRLSDALLELLEWLFATNKVFRMTSIKIVKCLLTVCLIIVLCLHPLLCSVLDDTEGTLG